MAASQQSCGVCSKAFGEPPEGGIQVACDGPCGKAFHLICADLSMPLLNARTAKVGLLWFCESCRLNFDDGVRQRETVLETRMREMFSEMQKLMVKVDSIDDNVRQLKQGAIPVLKNDQSSQVDDEDWSNHIVTSSSTSLERCESTEAPSYLQTFKTPQSETNESIVGSALIEAETCTDHEEVSTISITQEAKLPLSPKIWAQVFEHVNVINLCQIRLVCSQWKQIVDNDRLLMGKFKLELHEKITIDRDYQPTPMLPASSISFQNATIVTIGSWWSSRITEKLVNLELLNCRISMINLLEMLSRTPNLVSLTLHCGSTLTYNPAVNWFSDLRLQKMENLELDTAQQDEILVVIGRTFPNLKNFRLLSGNLKCQQGVLELIRTVPSVDGISLPHLPHDLLDLTQLGRQLRRVSFEWNVCDYELLIEFARKQPQLESLHFAINTPISKQNVLHDQALTEVFKHLSLLKRLTMSYCHAHGISYVQTIGRLNHLEYFAFYAVPNLQQFSFNGAKNPKLTELLLTRISYEPTEHPLREYIENAPNLRTITLEHCRLRSWSDLFAPIQLKQWRYLKLINVWITEKNEDHLYEYFDELRYLKMERCSFMSKEFLLAMFRLCPRVEELHLYSMEVYDAAVLTICQRMKHLRKLTLYYCPITEDAVKHIIEHAKKLEQLLIRSSLRGLSSEAKTQLEANILKVTYL